MVPSNLTRHDGSANMLEGRWITICKILKKLPSSWLENLQIFYRLIDLNIQVNLTTQPVGLQFQVKQTSRLVKIFWNSFFDGRLGHQPVETF